MATAVAAPLDQLRASLSWRCDLATIVTWFEHWAEANTADDALIATNDIGAIGYISRRPILDTVGLVEPPIVEHFLQGGTLLEYLQRRDPQYVIIFPNWYEDLSARTDLLEPVKAIELKLNVVCGGPKMVVYQPKWPTSR